MVINIWQHINDKAEQKTEQTEQKTEQTKSNMDILTWAP